MPRGGTIIPPVSTLGGACGFALPFLLFQRGASLLQGKSSNDVTISCDIVMSLSCDVCVMVTPCFSLAGFCPWLEKRTKESSPCFVPGWEMMPRSPQPAQGHLLCIQYGRLVGHDKEERCVWRCFLFLWKFVFIGSAFHGFITKVSTTKTKQGGIDGMRFIIQRLPADCYALCLSSDDAVGSLWMG